MMKKLLLVLLAVVAMAGTSVEAKTVSKTPVGCWSYKEVSEADSVMVQDTLVVVYRTDFDSLILCTKGKGVLEYCVTKRLVATTEDGFRKEFEIVDEYSIRFNWKYEKWDVHILSCYPDVSCTHVERIKDNRGTKYPSHFNNTVDEDAVEWMIDLLPRLKLVYMPENPEHGRLYSRGYKNFFRHCKGKPVIPTSKETII